MYKYLYCTDIYIFDLLYLFTVQAWCLGRKSLGLMFSDSNSSGIGVLSMLQTCSLQNGAELVVFFTICDSNVLFFSVTHVHFLKNPNLKVPDLANRVSRKVLFTMDELTYAGAQPAGGTGGTIGPGGRSPLSLGKPMGPAVAEIWVVVLPSGKTKSAKKNRQASTK